MTYNAHDQTAFISIQLKREHYLHVEKVDKMSKKIFVAYPEEEEKPKEMMLAKKWARNEIDLEQVENDLKNLIAIFDHLETNNSKYRVDEAKLTVGVTKDEEGKLHATIAASLLNLIKGTMGGELTQGVSENRLFEITIKRSKD